MKRIIVLVLVSLMMFSFVSCSDSDNNGNTNVELESEKITVTRVDESDSVTFTFSDMVKSVEDLESMDFTDEYLVASLVVFCLEEYEESPETSYEMMDYIKGPDEFSEYDKSFVKNQAEQYPYVMRSYFNSATVENDYEITDIEITVKENPYSRDEEGYVRLYLHSNGADSDRAVLLRKKESTGEWFLYSDSYKGLMAGIRAPKSLDSWS